MTTVHRLIAGMVNDKLKAIHTNRDAVLDGLKYIAWKDLPPRTRRLILRAHTVARDLQALEQALSRHGVIVPHPENRQVNLPVLRHDWWTIERTVKAAEGVRLDAIRRFKARALAETLGLPASDAAKATLTRLQLELEKL